MRSSERDHAEGTLDRIGGRLMEAWGALTGNGSAKRKGKAARGRGTVRRGKAKAKAKTGRRGH
jgi:uncharacterized protein YjbJ (UPF0337 family)